MKNVVIQTRRLNLCILQPTDLDYLNELDQDLDVRKFFPNGALNKEQISCRMNQFLSYYKVQLLGTAKNRVEQQLTLSLSRLEAINQWIKLPVRVKALSNENAIFSSCKEKR